MASVSAPQTLNRLRISLVRRMTGSVKLRYGVAGREQWPVWAVNSS